MDENTNPKQIVIDSSALLNFLLPDENTLPNIKRILSQVKSLKTQIIAPHLLRFEIANAIRSAFLRKRINKNDALIIIENFEMINIHYQKTNLTTTTRLALDHNLSVYDASYLELAISKKIPLLTLDKKLKQLSKKLPKQ